MDFNVSVLEGSSSSAAGLYRSDTYALASVLSRPQHATAWTNDFEGAPLCVGNSCHEVRTSGELGVWDQRIASPFVGLHVTPSGAKSFKWTLRAASDVSNLLVLYATDTSNYVALIRDGDGVSRVAHVVNGSEADAEHLGRGNFSWKTNFPQTAGCVFGDTTRTVVCVAHRGNGWVLKRRDLPAPAMTVAVIDETEIVVSEPGKVQSFSADAWGSPITLKSQIPIVSSGMRVGGGVVLVGHMASSAKGAATALEYYRDSSTTPAWSKQIAGDLTVTGTPASPFLAASDGKKTFHIGISDGVVDAPARVGLEFFDSDGVLARVAPGRDEGSLTLDPATR